jgi:rRNA-processing protein FCF1
MIATLLELGMLAAILWLLWGLRMGTTSAPALPFMRRNRLILDSCALIDGRIVEIVRSGFVISELIIPQFILNELQMLADGPDSHKRERARYGLDIAHELQDTAPMRVLVDRTVFPSIDATDDKLVALAKKLHAQLYTTDYNLGKVAAVEGVQVLNVNELSQSLRPITLPGEMLNIKIIQKGSNRDQGVGYLDDGTMIVIEGGAKYVGREMPVSVTRMHQTVAGKMVFGQVKEPKGGNPAAAAERDREREQRAAGAGAGAKGREQRAPGDHRGATGRLRASGAPASPSVGAQARARLRARFRLSPH